MTDALDASLGFGRGPLRSLLLAVVLLAACGAGPEPRHAVSADPAAAVEAVEAAPFGAPAVDRGPDTSAPVGVEHLHDVITSFDVAASGDAWIGFGPGARAFVIRAEDAEMLAFARAAFERGDAVHATVRAGHGPKRPSGGRPPAADPEAVRVLRLAATPEPDGPRPGAGSRQR